MILLHKQNFQCTKTLLLMLVILSIDSADLYGQNKLYFPGFIYFAGGIYNVDRSFDSYDSDNIPVFGAGIGLGTSQHMYAFANISYSFASEDDSIVITINRWVSPNFSTTKKTVAGASNFKQLHLNFGVYRNIFILSRFRYSIMGGVAIYKILLKSDSDNSSYLKNVDRTFPGFFVGMGGDYVLSNSKISIFLDGIWNITVPRINAFSEKEGGYSISTGLRYHFKKLRPLKKRNRKKRRT